MSFAGLDKSRIIALSLAAMLVVRAIVAAVTPLSFDEAYYWLWSKHLAWGYFDHPPLIAFIIRAGTAVFGDSSIGIRAIALVLGVVATAGVWRAASILLKNEWAGAFAALVFNVMPMVSVESMIATPDAPQIAAAAVLLYALAKIADTRRGEWWLVAGVAGGFALLSKYTAFFLGLGILAWLLLVPSERRWLFSPWPYVGGGIALLMFLPVIFWNADHQWVSFALQFGRLDNAAGGNRLTLRYLGEFLAGQLGLASPFIAILGTAGLVRIVKSRDALRSPLALIAAIMAPAVAYFIIHSLHDRVQGNWPSFLYPAFAVATVAAGAFGIAKQPFLLRLSQRLAVPVALFMTALIYAQAVWGLVPIVREPVGRLLAVGMERVVGDLEVLRAQNRADAVITTSYSLTGWLTYYLPTHPPVIQVNERYRYLDQPAPAPDLFKGPLLYVTEIRNDQAEALQKRFREVAPLAFIGRYRNGATFDQYAVYRVSEPLGNPLD